MLLTAKQSHYNKNSIFYIMGFLLFLYLGLENCVNGWFVTYFKSMDIMSSTYATNLVSVTWIMVMLGRLLTAKISSKVDKNKLISGYCVATTVFLYYLQQPINPCSYYCSYCRTWLLLCGNIYQQQYQVLAI